jgi:hypothetical protein
LYAERYFDLGPQLNPALSILCPGAAAAFPGGTGPERGRLLLFDLETTGLSGGAGTVAFLAAFARFVPDGEDRAARLRIVQYLLLDYPGEPDFLDLVLGEFAAADGGPVLVSYNGRAFDSQILRTRCLMNAVSPPDAPHLDLVYPARRLWRRSLESCSLAVVEREILGVERGDDLPGSEAPDAWFDYLRRGAAERLQRICEHNVRDLEGLAALLVKVESIASDPVGALQPGGTGGTDPEGLALRWLAAAKSALRGASGGADGLRRTAGILLELAAAAGSYRAAFALAAERSTEGDPAGAAELRVRVAAASGSGEFPPPSPGLRGAACRHLSMDAARRLQDREAALRWAEEGLSVPGLPEGARRALSDLMHRLSDGQ